MIRDNNASPTNIVEVLRLRARGLRSKIGGWPLGYSDAQPSIGVVIGRKVISETDAAFCKARRIRGNYSCVLSFGLLMGNSTKRRSQRAYVVRLRVAARLKKDDLL